MALSPLVNSVRTFLLSHFMHADDDWLSGCVDYLTEDNSFSENEIQTLAKEQWLLNDLKDICPGSLPSGLNERQKTVLNGRFVLQINAAVDIGTPAYQQYLKLQKVNMDNIDATTKFDDKVPSHRMIKLYLTDGIQEVSGIEYKPMRNLSCDITPGCKALIKGPVECRRGVLLLTEASVELLGGEVQEISVSNSLAGLLSTRLGLPISQEPDLNTTNQPRNANIPTPHAQMPPPRPETVHIERTRPVDRPIDRPVEITRPIARVTSIQVSEFTDDDIDIDQLAAIEAQIDSRPKRSLPDDENKPEKKLKVQNTADDYPDYDELFLEDEEHLRDMEEKFDAKRGLVTVSAEPFVYIKQINSMSEIDRAGRVFRVKGQIMKLLSKLSVGKDGWSLRCTIVDGTGSIDVEFTSGVLSKLVGFTPQEMNQLKREMATKPELKEKAVSALHKAKDTLQMLYCIIELTMLDVAKITCLIPFEDAHVDLLEKRIQNSGL